MNDYTDINSLWPKGIRPISRIKAWTLAKIIHRHFAPLYGVPRNLPYTEAPRHWASTAATADDLRAGVRRIAHDISHIMSKHYQPYSKNHGAVHAAIERAVVTWIIERGYHLPPPKPAPVSRKQRGYDATLAKIVAREAQIKGHEARLARAKVALAKLERARRRYEREGIGARP